MSLNHVLCAEINALLLKKTMAFYFKLMSDLICTCGITTETQTLQAKLMEFRFLLAEKNWTICTRPKCEEMKSCVGLQPHQPQHHHDVS